VSIVAVLTLRQESNSTHTTHIQIHDISGYCRQMILTVFELNNFAVKFYN